MPETMRVLLTIVLILCSMGVAAVDQGSPESVVERLHEALLRAMTQADSLGYQGRYQLLNSILVESFDIPTIGRIVTGRYWKEASDDQRASFVEVFERLITATYAANFSGFSGQHFSTISVEQGRSAMIVNTELVTTEDTIQLRYMLTGGDQKWQIVNVIAQGVSDLSLKRADYTAVIKKEGFSSLINRLNDKISAYDRGS